MSAVLTERIAQEHAAARGALPDVLSSAPSGAQRAVAGARRARAADHAR